MMYYRAIAGARFGRLNPPVFVEAGRRDEVLVFDRALRRDLECTGYFDDCVVRGQVPSGGPTGTRRGISLFSLPCPGVGPGGQSRDFAGGKGSVICELPAARVGEPRRHFTGEHG